MSNADIDGADATLPDTNPLTFTVVVASNQVSARNTGNRSRLLSLRWKME